MSEFHPEYLRPTEHMSEPDPRWLNFGSLNNKGQFEPISLDKYAEPIQRIQLIPSVPKFVRNHFETAKNLALFGWNVYRFLPVAELQAYISIELALRDVKKDKKRPFKRLLKEVIEDGTLCNEKFSQWKRVTESRELEYLAYKEENDLQTSEPPENWDYLSILIESIPTFRNNYAHGSSSIFPWPYLALESSAEIINQLYGSKS